MPRSIYLAGPEVFHPEADAIGREKKLLCETYGFVGLYPGELDFGDAEPTSAAIFAGCLAMLRAADILVANLTPFRGISADVGTVFELGYAHALGKPVFGYSHSAADLRTRIGHTIRPVRTDPTGRLFGSDTMSVEEFGLPDNLMLGECLRSVATALLRPAHDIPDWTDLSVFETCLRHVHAIGADTIP